MNALASDQVADFLNERFVSAYQKVGTFRIVDGRKQGGNVACYFCRPNGTVLHAVAGPVSADTLLTEARWAVELNKLAFDQSTNLATGAVDAWKYRMSVRTAHAERFRAVVSPDAMRQALDSERWSSGTLPQRSAHSPAPNIGKLPSALPRHVSNQGKIHWLLYTNTLPADSLPQLAKVSRVVWEQVLREQFSSLPVQTK